MSEAPGDSRSDRALLLASMFEAPSPDVARACLLALGRVGAGELAELSRHSLDVMLEEDRLGAPSEDVWDTLVQSGLFRQEGKVLVAAEEIELDGLFEESSARDSWSLPVAEVAAMLKPEPRSPSVSLPRLVDAIRRTQAWGLECCSFAERERLEGMPVFWECDEGRHTPFGTDFGTMAASDLPLLWAEGFRFGMPPRAAPEGAGAITRAWSRLLELGNRDGGWYDGAVAAPYFDDDFVGAFTPEQAARGSCPTTEATAERLYALCLLRAHAGAVDPDGALRARSGEAIAAAARCLLRWQGPEGAWAIHRYEPGSSLTAPLRDVSSRYACDALLMALSAGGLEQALAAEVREAMQRFAAFLTARAEGSGELAWWGGDFEPGDEQGRLRATTLAIPLCGVLAATLGDTGLSELQARAVGYVAGAWEPAADAPFEIAFRSPGWEGLALTTFTWEMPADALIISALLEWQACGGSLGEDLPGRILEATDAILEAELHGHWFDLAMAGEGELRAFGSNSLHYLRCLLAVASWQAEAAPTSLHRGILGRDQESSPPG